MVPGLLGILIDRFVCHAQPDIIEDDLQLKQRGSSVFCRVKEVVAGFAKQILEGLNEKLCLPISRHFSYLPVWVLHLLSFDQHFPFCYHPESGWK